MMSVLIRKHARGHEKSFQRENKHNQYGAAVEAAMDGPMEACALIVVTLMSSTNLLHSSRNETYSVSRPFVSITARQNAGYRTTQQQPGKQLRTLFHGEDGLLVVANLLFVRIQRLCRLIVGNLTLQALVSVIQTADNNERTTTINGEGVTHLPDRALTCSRTMSKRRMYVTRFCSNIATILS